jgi:hypothetical protein
MNFLPQRALLESTTVRVEAQVPATEKQQVRVTRARTLVPAAV